MVNKKQKNNYFQSSLKDLEYVEQIDNIVVELFKEKPIELDDIVIAFWSDKKYENNLYMSLVFDRFKAKIKAKYKIKIKLDFENEKVYIDGECDINKIKEKLDVK